MATLTLNRFLLHIRSVESHMHLSSENAGDYDDYLHDTFHDIGDDAAGGLEGIGLVDRSANVADSSTTDAP